MKFTKPEKLPRLTARYKYLATIAAIVVLALVAISTWYVADIKHSSSDSLQHLRKIKQLSALIRHKVVDAELVDGQ